METKQKSSIFRTFENQWAVMVRVAKEGNDATVAHTLSYVDLGTYDSLVEAQMASEAAGYESVVRMRQEGGV
tara:strand:+ start:1441 stop:1656 length:216 start_codon:yes stop_codon:yes gene_type:complete